MTVTVPYALSRSVRLPFEEATAAVRAALAEQGFGVLNEIDMAATLHAKLGVDVPPVVILGACRPPLALKALEVEPSVGLLLPCNVVVRAGDGCTIVEAVDPSLMVSVTGNDRLAEVAADATERLSAALNSLAPDTSADGPLNDEGR